MSGMFEQVAYRPFKDIPLVTALPSNPSNGDMVVLTDSLSAGTYFWTLKYVAARSSNKWVFIGGIPLYAVVETPETTAATAYAALATAGPSIAIPVAGDYMINHGFTSAGDGTVSNNDMSYDIGGTGAVTQDQCLIAAFATASMFIAGIRKQKKTGLTAVTLTSKYKVSAGTGTFAYRWIEAIPIAIGG